MRFSSFFVKVSSLASLLFADKNFHTFKQNTLSVVYSQIQTNSALKESFHCLLDTVLGQTNDITGDSEEAITCEGDKRYNFAL